MYLSTDLAHFVIVRASFSAKKPQLEIKKSVFVVLHPFSTSPGIHVSRNSRSTIDNIKYLHLQTHILKFTGILIHKAYDQHIIA